MVMEPDLLGSLIDRHGAALVLYARQWCGTPEDVVQEAFLKLFRQEPAPERALPWLYRVVRNAAQTAGRGERRRRRHEAVAAGRAAAWFTADADSVLDARTAADVLARLGDDEREVIVAHLWGGLSFEDIGAVMGCSASTAYRSYAAGLTALRDRLRVPCPNPSTTPT